MAGSVARYSHPTTEAIAELLVRLARPIHPEKSLEELGRLLEHIRTKPVHRSPAANRSHRIERRVSSEQLDEIVRRYATGESTPTLAREFGVAEGSIGRLLRNRGIELRLRPLSDEVVARAVELYADGLGVQAVADQLRVPKSTLLRAMKAVGVPLRPPKRADA